MTTLKNTVRFHNTKDVEDLSRTPRANDTTILIELADGHTLSVDTTQLSKDIVQQAMLHGLKQKLVDSVAGKSGKEASNAIEATFDMLSGGDWTRAREGGTSSSTTLLIEAMQRLFKKSKDECQMVIDGLSEEDAKALPKHKQIAAMILTIKAERAATKAEAATSKDDGESDFNPFA